MIDLTGCKEVFGDFAGSERKITLYYNNEKYMIKFPDPVREMKNDLSYMNNQFSEDIGCKIFKSIGIPVQETFLAKYTSPEDGKTRIVVACKDFRIKALGDQRVSAGNINLTNFHSNKRISTNIEDVNYIINKITTIDKEAVRERFWDTFVVDALIGNVDRHLDNWGFITDEDDNIIRMSPVYDCGSSLGALLSDEKMQAAINDESKFKDFEYNVASVYFMNGERIIYPSIFKSPPDDLKKAVLRIVPKINMKVVQDIVNNEEGMSNIRKTYLNKALTFRYEKVLVPSLHKIMKEQYSSIENIAVKITNDLKSGRDMSSIQKEALKFMPSTSIVRKKIMLREALKLASKDKTTKKLIEKYQGMER